MLLCLKIENSKECTLRIIAEAQKRLQSMISPSLSAKVTVPTTIDSPFPFDFSVISLHITIQSLSDLLEDPPEATAGLRFAGTEALVRRPRTGAGDPTPLLVRDACLEAVGLLSWWLGCPGGGTYAGT